MTDHHMTELLTRYSLILIDGGFKPLQFTVNQSRLEHACWMCDQARGLFVGDAGDVVNAENVRKAMRWLGCIQGILWCEGVYTIAQMREHSRSSKTGGNLPIINHPKEHWAKQSPGWPVDSYGGPTNTPTDRGLTQDPGEAPLK